MISLPSVTLPAVPEPASLLLLLAGLQNILEDYVNQEWARMGAILAEKTICALLWLASTLAVLRIAI